jgi:hypothetical protein
MTISRKEIGFGKCFVNERSGIAREVVEELGNHKVKYNAFDLATGRLVPAPGQACYKGELAFWADREARPEEIAKLHPYEPTAWFENVPTREIKTAELELTKTRMLQALEHNTAHRC